ncbi:hypothetical protein KDN24_14330 [Bacillus sp. Bva_UNVM-123]|uniref:N-acetylglucosamine kinase n=1 Tax=Bacillus sp. Bva_UNVM-123 TaxID=2829798 RepID=UPI00391F428C
MTNQSFHLLAIDGGGTKTQAVITDQEGLLIGEGRAGASNYQVVGRETAVATLVASIREALLNTGVFTKETDDLFDKTLANDKPIHFKKIVFALAGIDTTNDESVVREIVIKTLAEIGITYETLLVENDCLSALLGATQNKAGALLISGTGSIVFAHDGEGNFFRTGGWGYRVGDEGSGYWIGKEAIRSVLKMKDGREKETILLALILKKFGFEKVDDLYSWVYSPAYSVDDVSALTTSVEEAYKMGDEVCKTILDRAAAELTLLLEATIEKAGIAQKEFQLLLQGGVLQNNHYVKEKVLDCLQKEVDKVSILHTDEKPIRFIIKRGLAL